MVVKFKDSLNAFINIHIWLKHFRIILEIRIFRIPKFLN